MARLTSYDPAVDLAERGDAVRRHPWETERAQFFRSLIAHHLGDGCPRRILDIGAGDGWFAGELSQEMSDGSEVVCWDINYRSADLAADLPDGVIRTADEPTGSFDLVLLLDVIEHVDDDAAFLDSAVLPHVTDRSLVVVSVPAYQSLVLVPRRCPRPPPPLLAPRPAQRARAPVRHPRPRRAVRLADPAAGGRRRPRAHRRPAGHARRRQLVGGRRCHPRGVGGTGPRRRRGPLARRPGRTHAGPVDMGRLPPTRRCRHRRPAPAHDARLHGGGALLQRGTAPRPHPARGVGGRDRCPHPGRRRRVDRRHRRPARQADRRRPRALPGAVARHQPGQGRGRPARPARGRRRRARPGRLLRRRLRHPTRGGGPPRGHAPGRRRDRGRARGAAWR